MATLTKLNDYVEEITRLHESATQGADDLIKLGQLLDDAKDSGEYKHESATFADWCKLHWGWSANYVGRLRRAARFVQAQQLLADTGHDVEVPESEGAARKMVEKSVPKRTVVIDVSAEVQTNLSKNMGAQQCGPTEMNEPPPYPVPVQPPTQIAPVMVPIPIATHLDAIIREAKKLVESGPEAFKSGPFGHLIGELQKLRNGMQMHFTSILDQVPAIKPKSRATLEQLREFCVGLGLPESDGDWFLDKMLQFDWKVDNKPVKDVFATIRNWNRMKVMCSQKLAQAAQRNGKPEPKNHVGQQIDRDLARIRKGLL